MIVTLFIIGVVVAAGSTSWVILRSGRSLEDAVTTTGAQPGSQLDRMLQLQHLSVEDIEANRTGRLSPRQAVRLTNDARKWTTMLWIGILALVVTSAIIALSFYVKTGRPAVLIAPAIGVVLAAPIYFGFVAMFGRPGSEITSGKVTAVQGTIEKLDLWPSRDRFIATIAGVAYRGIDSDFGAKLSKGQVVNAYVLPASRRLVAVDPQ